MDQIVSELRKAYNYISKNQPLTEENIKINLVREVFLRQMGYDLINCTYERDSKGKRSDISIAIHEGREIFFIETKRGDEKLSCENVNQILNYLKAPGMEWGLITNGKEYILVNAKIDTPPDLNNEAYKHAVVFWFDIFEVRNQDRTEIKYFKYLEYECLFEKRTTSFYKDIAQFKALAFPDNKKSWSTYKSTLSQFYDFFSEKRRSKYKNGILEEISPEDFRSFIEFKQSGESGARIVTSSQSIANIYSHISSMLNTLKDNGKISRTLFDKGRSYGLEDFEITGNKKSDNYLTTENVRAAIEYYCDKNHGERDVCIFLLCASIGLERPNIIELLWDDVNLTDKKPYVRVGTREMELSPLLISCFKVILKEHKNEKIRSSYVFNTYYKGKYNPFSETTVNGVFDKLKNIGDEEKWSYFSPQYVRICLVDVLFDLGYSIDEIIFQTGIDIKNIHRYISNEDIISRQKKNQSQKGVTKKKIFNGLLEISIEEWKTNI
jgi:integrase/recombinase XerD